MTIVHFIPPIITVSTSTSQLQVHFLLSFGTAMNEKRINKLSLNLKKKTKLTCYVLLKKINVDKTGIREILFPPEVIRNKFIQFEKT